MRETSEMQHSASTECALTDRFKFQFRVNLMIPKKKFKTVSIKHQLFSRKAGVHRSHDCSQTAFQVTPQGRHHIVQVPFGSQFKRKV